MQQNKQSDCECIVENRDYFNKNIKYLINRYGKDFYDYEELSNGNDEVSFKKMRKNCKIEVKESNNIIKMYEKFEFDDEIKNNNIYIIYGFGMGSYVNDIFKKTNGNNYLLIIEPNESIFKKALQENSFKDLFLSNKTYITIGNDVKKIERTIKVILSRLVERAFEMKFITNAGYEEHYGEFYEKVLSMFQEHLKFVHPNLFPLMFLDKTFLGEPIFETEDKQAYFTGYYNALNDRFKSELWQFNKVEVLYGKKINKGEISLNIDEKSILPICALEDETNLQLEINNKTYDYQNMYLNTFNYYPINKGKINIKTNKDIILGKTIPLIQNKKHKNKLVLFMFFDGLAKYAMNKEVLKDVMPNTMKFFDKGAKFSNCFFNSEWTLPSVPNIFSGKYASKHRIFHPESVPYPLGYDYRILSEYFQDEGYLTFQVGGDWRKNPLYGYAKGFDRTIYKYGMNYQEVIFDYLEQMRAFKNRNQFAWLTFFDLHDLTLPIPDIANQIDNSLEAHNYKETNEKSVYKTYDKEKSEMFLTEAKKLDFYLKILYDYLEENYSDDELLVVLCSDHGQTYLGKDAHPLSDSRSKIPLMIKGRGVPEMEVDELVENVDILPMVLKLSDIEFKEEFIDGRVPKAFSCNKERKYVYYESIYPNKTFKAVVRDREHKLLFETKEKVTEDGRVKIGKYTVELINLRTSEDEKVENKSKVTKYIDVILTNIKDISILDNK